MRDYSIDLLRFLAAAFVVLLHCTAMFMDKDFSTSPFMEITALNGITRWTVPVFVMISGAFMLHKNISIHDLFRRYILHLIFLLLAWNIIYFFVNNGIIPPQKIGHVLFPNCYHLWFLYMLISLYILIPILKAIIKDNIGCYMVALWFFCEITTNTIEFWYPTTHILESILY